MLFTPINFLAFNSLKGAEIAQGASMLNLSRQMGGSLGIALISSYITKRAALHYNVLGANTALSNPVFVARLKMMSQTFMSRGFDAISANQAALKSLNGTIQREAATMSYNDAFLLIGLSIVVVSPVLFLLRPKKSGGGAAGAEMGH
jgi:DHA2 family multidrug resistance protein